MFLCSCPSVFIPSALLVGVAYWFGDPSLRRRSVWWLALTLFGVVMATAGKIRDERKVKRWREQVAA
jgi:hypothetical protein